MSSRLKFNKWEIFVAILIPSDTADDVNRDLEDDNLLHNEVED